jgi:hypothetical protein
MRVVSLSSPRAPGKLADFLLPNFAPLEAGWLLVGLSRGNIAPFGLTVGVGVHFPAYLYLERDFI